MPYIWTNNRVAVEKEEICLEYWDKSSDRYLRAKKEGVLDLFWSKLNTLQSELRRYKERPYGIKRLTRGHNGSILRIDFDSLKKELQDELGDPRKCDNPLEKYFEFNQAAVLYYADFKRCGNRMLQPEQDRYIMNASVLDAAIQLKAEITATWISMNRSLRGLEDQVLKEVIHFNKWLKVNYDGSTHNLPSTLKHFKPALNSYEIDGFYTLIKDPEGKSRDNARKVDDMVLTILRGLFDQDYKPNRTEIARAYDGFLSGYNSVYNENSGELFDPKGYPELSNSTVTRYLAMWENRIGSEKKRNGNRQQYMAKYMPHAQMDLPKFSGSIISIDDRNPPFWYEKGKRMWFYIGIDIASGCFTTFVYGKSKEGIIIDFYRQMVRNHADWNLCLPAELECESSLNSSFKNTFLKDGQMFKYVKIEANNAQAKIIERRFGQMRYEVEKKAPGWIARPFAKSEHNQESNTKRKIIPYNDLVKARLADIEDWNNMPHHEDAMQSRWEYFLNNQHPDLKPINYAAILPYLGYRQPTSCKRGFIALQNRNRAIAENGTILTGDALLDKMRMIEGKDIEVYWLDGNDGGVLKAYAYSSGRFVCEVMEFPRFNRAKIEQTDECRAAIDLQMAYKMTVAQFARESANSIEKIGIIDNRPKPERKFKIGNLERYEANENSAKVEQLETVYHEDDEEIMYNPEISSQPTQGWRSTFLNQ